MKAFFRSSYPFCLKGVIEKLDGTYREAFPRVPFKAAFLGVPILFFEGFFRSSYPFCLKGVMEKLYGNYRKAFSFVPFKAAFFGIPIVF